MVITRPRALLRQLAVPLIITALLGIGVGAHLIASRVPDSSSSVTGASADRGYVGEPRGFLTLTLGFGLVLWAGRRRNKAQVEVIDLVPRLLAASATAGSVPETDADEAEVSGARARAA